MEAMLGISLYIYPYLNYKNCLYFLCDKIRDKGRIDSAWKQGDSAWGVVGRNDPNNVCTYENKQKNKLK
jgi:hypothetical protein